MVLETISKGDSWQPGGLQISKFSISSPRSIGIEQASRLGSVLSSKATLLLTSPESYKKTTASLLKLLVKDKNLPGIYVTVNRSCKDIYSEMNSVGISDEKVFVMDMISETTGTESKNSTNCVYLHSPQSLTDLAIAIDEAVAAMNTKEMFLIIDSFSTFFVYNPPSVVVQFANFITNKIRSWGIKGILIALPNELDEKSGSLLRQFCDEIIEED